MVLRRLSTVALLVLIAVTVAMAVFVVAARPALARDRDRVDVEWARAASALGTRYEQLGEAAGKAADALGEDRTPLAAIRRDVARWKALHFGSGSQTATQVLLANALEGEVVRLRTLVSSTGRLQSAPAVSAAMDALTQTDAPGPRRAYDDAVRVYEHARRGLARRLAATLLGYRSRPTLEVPATTS